ncbi:MAG: hypothetical protein E7160_01125 [Firmicutes bacterium]|nr:hypothetical protein [Bacillota bacterium]
MKNLLLEYYGIEVNSLYKKNGKVYFRYKKNIFVLDQVHNKEDEYRILNSYYGYLYDTIIINRKGQAITKIAENKYILLKKNKHKNETDIYETVRKNLNDLNEYKKNPKLNWTILWEEKIDYYENLFKYLDNYKVIGESAPYYIGMAETAISYIRYNFIEQDEKMVLSHKRMDRDDYYNPVNIIVDYRTRDVAEMLKLSFYKNEYKKSKIINIVQKVNFSRNEYILLYGRLLFPSFYFDICDQIIINQKNEEELSMIIRKSTEYEKFLNEIYIIINSKIKIPKINWV